MSQSWVVPGPSSEMLAQHKATSVNSPVGAVVVRHDEIGLMMAQRSLLWANINT